MKVRANAWILIYIIITFYQYHYLRALTRADKRYIRLEPYSYGRRTADWGLHSPILFIPTCYPEQFARRPIPPKVSFRYKISESTILYGMLLFERIYLGKVCSLPVFMEKSLKFVSWLFLLPI
jgi:hypothetical protein